MRTYRNEKGSALIMAIAVVTMLAIVGAMFLLMSRIEEGSTSSLEEFKSLDAAVDSVIATVATELKLDTPGVTANTEYYDYPGDNDKWLANLEPEPNGTNYGWQQISDIFKDSSTGQYYFDKHSIDSTNIQATIVKENEPIPTVSQYPDALADADGDGVADSKWVKLDNISSSTGRPIYAAIRVIDNGGMLNVNTAYKFDPELTTVDDVSGRYLRNINLMGFTVRDITTDINENDITDLLDARGITESNLPSYENYAVYNFQQNYGGSTPFDISDELEMRNRFLLNNTDIDTRLEAWGGDFRLNTSATPFTDLAEWEKTIYSAGTSATLDPNYAYRHLATTYNADRAIDPDGNKALVVNYQYMDPNIQTLYSRIADKFDARTDMTSTEIDDYKKLHAQILANLQDFDDHEVLTGYTEDVPQVTVLKDENGDEYYGFERPYVFISELVRAFKWEDDSNTADPNTMHRSYGIEICKDPRTEVFDKLATIRNEFRLRIENPDYEITVESKNFEDRGGRFYVRIFDDPNISLEDNVEYSDSPWNGATGVDPNVVLDWNPYAKADPNWQYDVYIGTDPNAVKDANDANISPGVGRKGYGDRSYKPTLPFDTGETYYWRIDDVDSSGKAVRDGKVWKFTTWTTEPNNIEAVRGLGSPPVFTANSTLILERWVEDKTKGIDNWLEVDRVECADINTVFFNNDNGTLSYKRNLSWQKVLKRIWENQSGDSLGNYGGHFFSDSTDPVPLNGQDGFITIGELGFVYDVDIYNWDKTNYNKDEDVLVDLTDPNVNILFNYLTRIHSGDPNENRVKGRININTAPWYVIAQLPWASKRENGVTLTEPYALAKAIVAYRDKLLVDGVWGYKGNNGRHDETGITDIREELGFSNIGELTTVMNTSNKDEYDMRFYILGSENGNDQIGYPDLHFDERTGTDGIVDDLEERNLIFARISDLVTVRSDVFTAYILVRLGEDGPQRRIIAILDRSEVGKNPSTGLVEGKVKIIAKYPVPDPR